MGRIFQTDFLDYPRPRDNKGSVCGYEFRGKVCTKRGAHHCEPRADKVVAFFAEQLTLQSGPMALQPFVLEDWQEWEIVRPLFGEVHWTEWGCYGRRYSLATIVISRKNGKTGLLSGIGLYLLVADGILINGRMQPEYGAQIYTAAIDTDQAKLVFGPAANMVKTSPELPEFVNHNKQTNTLEFRERASYFKVIPSDAAGALGFNPHGVIIDEILNQPGSQLYDALRTGMGARVQPLMILATTETDKAVSFGASEIDQAERIQEDPSRAWHHFVYVRKTPQDEKQMARLERLFPGHPDLPVATFVDDGKGGKKWSIDIYDERNWKWSNPALGTFLKFAAMRQEAVDAQKSKTKEAAFKQFRLNMRVQPTTRFIDLPVWDANAGPQFDSLADLRSYLVGQKPTVSWAGLDLSSKLDLTAWVLLFPDGSILPRFWIPEERVARLTEQTAGKFGEWVNAGWVKATDGDTIDYEDVYADIARDATDFVIQRVVYDKWSGEPVRQKVEQLTGLEMVESDTTFNRMTNPMNELQRMLTAKELRHHGHPVMRWMADNLEAKRPTDDPDRVRPVKPDKEKDGKHVDGMLGLLFAIDSKLSTAGKSFRSAYEDGGLIVV